MGYKRREPDDGSQESQPEGGKEAEAAVQKLDQAERQRNKKLRRDGNLSSNISFAASSRVWLEEELAKVAAFPPLREVLGTTGTHVPTLTISREQAMASRPARELMQLEKPCELDPNLNPHAPPRRPTADELTALHDILVHLSSRHFVTCSRHLQMKLKTD